MRRTTAFAVCLLLAGTVAWAPGGRAWGAAAEVADRLAEDVRKATVEARYLLLQKRLDEAIGRLEHILSLDPAYEAAKELLAEARERRTRVDAHLDQARALARGGKWDEAFRALHEAQALFPGHESARVLRREIGAKAATAHLANAKMMLGLDDLDGAETELRKALAFDPDRQETREALADLLARRGAAASEQGRPGAALLWYQASLEQAPAAPVEAQLRAARSRILDRTRFSIAFAAPAGEAQPLVGAAAVVQTRVWKHLAERLGDLVTLRDRPAEAARADYVVRIDAGPPDVRTQRVRTENRTHPYTVTRQEPNPEYERLVGLLDAARTRLEYLRAEYDRPCVGCDGRGWLMCRVCRGTGWDPRAPDTPCPRCTVHPWSRPGWLRCSWCGGTGRGGSVSLTELRRAEDEVVQLERRLAREPRIITRRVPEQWPYTVEHHEKVASLEAGVAVTDAAAGNVMLRDVLRRSVRHTDTTIQDARPDIGLRADGLDLPPDDQLREAVVAEVGGALAAKVLEAIAEARMRRLRGEADRLLAGGQDLAAIEAGVDAAVLRETVDREAAAVAMRDLRERLRAAEQGGPAPM